MAKIIRTRMLVCAWLVISTGPLIAGQNRSGNQVELKTRLVVIDALVKEKRTGMRIDDLQRADFEVLDEGKRRVATHFSVGERGRPLALVLLFDLAHEGAGRFFHQSDIPAALAAALSKLTPRDEVAIIAMTGRETHTVERDLTPFTNDHKEIAEALSKLPEVTTPDSFGVLFVADLLAAVAGDARTHRPNSDVVIIYVTDSLNGATPAERRRGAESLLRNDVMFNALLTKTSKSVTARSIPFMPLLLAFGISTNGADHFAKQTGGQVVRVNSPEDYRAGLEKIIGDLASRYTLGFELEPGEPNDGRFHRLEVKVKARDGSGKQRKLEVIARRAYYLPKPQESAKRKTDEPELGPAKAQAEKRERDEQAIKQAVYDSHYSVMTGDIEGIKRVTSKRTLGLCRTLFDLLFHKMPVGDEAIPASNGDELFALVLGILAESSKEGVSTEQIREKARAKSQCRITFISDELATIEYPDGISTKAVFEDGRWKIDDSERIKSGMLKSADLTAEEKERIKKY